MEIIIAQCLWILFCVVHLFRFILTIYCKNNKNRVENTLYNAMWNVAKANNVPIFLKPEKQMYVRGELCAGYFSSKVFNEKFTPYGFYYIAINEKYKNNLLEFSFICAHELGHLISIRNNNDNSEKSADLVGKELINSSLSLIERLAFGYIINKYFDHKVIITEEYK